MDLCQQGVELQLSEDRQRVAAPRRALTPEMRGEIALHREALLELLVHVENYRTLLRSAFGRLTASRAVTRAERERFVDEQTRLMDELGPALLSAVLEATARDWRSTTGICAWCGARGRCERAGPHGSPATA
jgi:hypothetical protein